MNLLIGIIEYENEKSRYKIIDTDTRQVKYFGEFQLICSIKKGLAVENITVKNNSLHSLNGSLDRYRLRDRHGFTIEAEGDYKYLIITIKSRVIDDKGNTLGYEIITSDGKISTIEEQKLINILEGNKSVGLSNGKVIVKQNGEKYISSINGEYPTIVKKRLGSKRQKYTGSVSNEPYTTVVMVYSRAVSLTSTVLTVLEMENTQIRKYSIFVNAEDIEKLIYKTGNLYFLGHCALFGYLEKKLSMTADINEIRQLLKIKENRDWIDNSIASVAKGLKMLKRSVKIDSETGIYLPQKGVVKYPTVKLKKYLDSEYNIFEEVSEDIINRYIKFIKAMKTSVVCQFVPTNKEYFAVKRSLNNYGIDYLAVAGKELHLFKGCTLKIEDIYNTIEDIANATINGDTVQIIGLDGAYNYDMTKIFNEYHRNVITTLTKRKTELLGVDYRDCVTKDGVLLSLQTDMKVIQIPKEVTIIGQEAIDLTLNNEEIIIGSHVKKCHTAAITGYDSNVIAKGENITVHIECCEEAALNVLKSVYRWSRRYVHATSPKIIFRRNITYKELAYIISNTETDIDINNSLIDWTDEYILKAIRLAVKLKLKELEVVAKKKTVVKTGALFASDSFYYLDRSQKFKEHRNHLKKLFTVWDKYIITKIKSTETMAECIEVLESIKKRFTEEANEYERIIMEYAAKFTNSSKKVEILNFEMPF